MPRIARDGDLHTISYITGPRHVWLGVAFTDQSDVRPHVIKRPPVGSCNHGELDPDRILAAVVAGMKDSGMYPKRIEFVANDSPTYALYEYCARLLASHAAAESGAHILGSDDGGK